MAYTTKEKVESFLRTTFDGESTPTSDEVDEMVSKVDDAVDDLVGTTFSTKTAEETFDIPYARNVFVLSNYPVKEIKTIEYNKGGEFDEDWSAIEDYRLSGNTVITKDMYTGNNKVKIEYDWGYDNITKPVEELATLLIARYIIYGDDAGNNEFEDISVGGLSISRNIGTDRLANINTYIDTLKKELSKRKTIAR